MLRMFSHRWIAISAAVCIMAAVSLPSHAVAAKAQAGVIVSNQNNCSVGPTNDNSLSPSQTAYVWLVTHITPTGYTYEITGTNNSFDSGIQKVKFNGCRGTKYFWAKFTTPATAGGYTLTVFDATGAKVSSDNFTVT
jgi:hypothetical protein